MNLHQAIVQLRPADLVDLGYTGATRCPIALALRSMTGNLTAVNIRTAIDTKAIVNLPLWMQGYVKTYDESHKER